MCKKNSSITLCSFCAPMFDGSDFILEKQKVRRILK